MPPAAAGVRRQLLRDVRDGIAAGLADEFEAKGFRFLKQEAAFKRERNGVVSLFRLGIVSRPPSLGHVGILVYPAMTVAVPAWSADAERRVTSESKPLRFREWSSPVAFTFLEWHVPGKRPLWTLSDEPTDVEVGHLGRALRDAVASAGLPFLERWATTDQLLDGAAAGELPVLHEARFTIACGALLSDRPDRARAVIAPIGTARQEGVTRLLGLPAEETS